MGPDFRVLVAKARKIAQAYWKVYGEYPPTKVLVQEVAGVMQKATQSGLVGISCDQPSPFFLASTNFSVPRRHLLVLDQLISAQRSAAIWYFPAYRWMGLASRSKSVSSRSIWIVLGLESERDRKEHSEWKDFPGKEVSLSHQAIDSSLRS